MTPDEHTASPSVERMLDAAECLVVDRGAAHLTLDAVATAAGVSKGGLLYHFPSKSALLKAMVRRHLSHVDERAAQYAQESWAQCGTPPYEHQVAGRLRALLEKDSAHRAMGAAMVAAAVSEPALMDPVRERRRELHADIRRLALPFERAAILYLAVDGLLLTELLHLSCYDANERAAVVEAIISDITRAHAQSIHGGSH